MAPIVPVGQLVYGMQLPIQAQSQLFVQPWEPAAGPAELAAVAQACDRAGFFYVAVCDHVAIPQALADRMGTTWYDPISTLGWIAAQTQQVRLLTSVFNLSYRHPLVAAKQFATLDRLSGGRVIAGLGAGHAAGEFEALGVDYHRRGALLDDGIAVFASALEQEYPTGYDVGLQPRPVQVPRPPIWIGGSAPAAVRRAARCDGWIPQGTPFDQMPGLLEAYRDERRRVHGESAGDGDIGAITPWCYVGTPAWDVGRQVVSGEPEAIAAELSRWATLGVNHLQVGFPSRSSDELIDQIEAFGKQVAPLLHP